MTGTLHVLHSLRAEGCPRLVLSLLDQEALLGADRPAVMTMVEDEQELRREFDRRGVVVVTLGWRRRGFIGAAFRARQLLADLRPSGVICYTVGQHVPIGLAARSLRIPLVLHLGCAPPADRLARFKIRLQMMTGLPFVRRYAACSTFVREESIRAYHLPPRLVSTVPNGIDTESFARVRELRATRAPNRPQLVGMVGSLEPSKAHKTLIEAMALVGPDRWRLRLIGGGSLEPELRELATRLGVANRIEWRGVVSDVPSELAALDLFAYSVKEEEGLGIALVEALAAGVPVVASDVGACREVLEHGRLGRLVPVQSAAAWAAALSETTATPPVGLDATRRYDIGQTARAYRVLLDQGPQGLVGE